MLEANPDLERVVDAYTDLKMNEPYGAVKELAGRDAAQSSYVEITEAVHGYDSAAARGERSLKEMVRHDADTMLGRAWKHVKGYLHLSKEEKEMKSVLHDTVERKYGDVDDVIGDMIKGRYAHTIAQFDSTKQRYDELGKSIEEGYQQLKDVKQEIKDTQKAAWDTQADINLYNVALNIYNNRISDPESTEGYGAIQSDIGRAEDARDELEAQLDAHKARRSELKDTVNELKTERYEVDRENYAWAQESFLLDDLFFDRFEQFVDSEGKD